jgi:16S rRNA (cytosine1402-N4)-methyltransferase
VDGTLGAGRHAEAILQAVGGRCTVIGIDRDPDALARARYTLRPWGDAVRFAQGGFADIEFVLQTLDGGSVDGILLDLGMSSMQVDDPARGFSFRHPGPLDMRMDPSQSLTAADVVNTYSGEDLTRILRRYGEERNAGRIARAILDARRHTPIRTTDELARIVVDAYPGAARRRGHPARQTFQALRMEVNGELDQLERALRAAPDVLAPGGRIVVLSYHSLEDKLTKRIFDELAGPKPELPGLPAPAGPPALLRPLHRGAILPSEAEVERNPRASSARLRAAERTAEAA